MIEFKESEILRTKEGKKKIAQQIVAFTNRFGGKLLIGIKDDGKFEGKNIFNVDKDKEIIVNIIQTKISPVLNCDIEFLDCNKGDVIIVDVPKRKDMPHAYVKKATGGEIINREYLIRTPHGVRHVSDRQLQYLFKEQQLNFDYIFTIGFNFIRESLEIPSITRLPPAIELIYTEFLNNFLEEDIKLLLSSDITNIICQITPYMILKSFTHYFNNSWNIKIQKEGIFTINTNSPKKRITIDDLPEPPKDSILSTLSVPFKNYLRKIWFNDFFIPPKTTLRIDFKKDLGTKLILEDEDFEFSIGFFSIQGGAGIESSHPQSELNYEKSLESINDIQNDYFYMKATGIYSAKFNLPEKNFELFEEYYQFALTIKKIIEKEWDYERFIKKFPHRILYSIKKDVNNILGIMKKKV